MLITAIENCWLLKCVIWKAVLIDKLFPSRTEIIIIMLLSSRVEKNIIICLSISQQYVPRDLSLLFHYYSIYAFLNNGRSCLK